MMLAMSAETVRWVWWEAVMWLAVIAWMNWPGPPRSSGRR
jgi:hypothetical protein